MATLLVASWAGSDVLSSPASIAACTCFRPVLLRSGQNRMRSSRFCSVMGPTRTISALDQASTVAPKAFRAASRLASDGAAHSALVSDAICVVAVWKSR